MTFDYLVFFAFLALSDSAFFKARVSKSISYFGRSGCEGLSPVWSKNASVLSLTNLAAAVTKAVLTRQSCSKNYVQAS